VYRDRPPECPRCAIPLERPDDTRESWNCASCLGTLVATQELVRAIVEIEPGLVPEDGVKGLRTLGRKTREAALPCGVCRKPMEPVFLGGAALDRCYLDEVLWLDQSEHDQVLVSARVQGRTPPVRESWLRRLLDRI
jgi:hypothetical protein